MLQLMGLKESPPEVIDQAFQELQLKDDREIAEEVAI
jgi:hypothetical protein